MWGACCASWDRCLGLLEFAVFAFLARVEQSDIPCAPERHLMKVPRSYMHPKHRQLEHKRKHSQVFRQLQ